MDNGLQSCATAETFEPESSGKTSIPVTPITGQNGLITNQNPTKILSSSSEDVIIQESTNTSIYTKTTNTITDRSPLPISNNEHILKDVIIQKDDKNIGEEIINLNVNTNNEIQNV